MTNTALEAIASSSERQKVQIHNLSYSALFYHIQKHRCSTAAMSQDSHFDLVAVADDNTVWNKSSLSSSSSAYWTSSAAGWILVVITDSKSAGPRESISNWIPRSGLISCGVLISLLAAIINIAICLALLRRRSTSGYSELTSSSSSSWRRISVINFSVVQLTLGVVVVPIKVVTDALGVWTMGPMACRVYLLAQVRQLRTF